MKGLLRWSVALAALSTMTHPQARAQWGYPGGYGPHGWAGWGLAAGAAGLGGAGGSTVQGSIASGLGAFAAGAGQYNEQTAVANSINADTVMRWNQYVYQSQQEANRKHYARMARRSSGNEKNRDLIYKRLHDNPEPRDIHSGDALNVAFDEVSNPSIYTRTIAAAKVPIGGTLIRNIPFQYAAAAITTSFHDVTNKSSVPAILKTQAFAAEREAFKVHAAALRKQAEETGGPDPGTLKEALKVVEAAEAKVEATLAKNSRDRVAAEKYLKALHGLLRMLETPAMDILLSGVEKRPEATLGELLNFMRAFNLRFGPAKTVAQQRVYDTLYPKLVALRDEVVPSGTKTVVAEPNQDDAGEFFSGMAITDLKKKPPAPPVPRSEPN